MAKICLTFCCKVRAQAISPRWPRPGPESRLETLQRQIDENNPEIKKQREEESRVARKAADAARKAADAAKRAEAETLRQQAIADKANNDRQAAAKAARNKQGADQVRALQAEQTAAVARLDQEVKTITADTGAANQERYEAQLATNAGLQASGAPIVRTAAQERAFQRQGRAYALPNEVLKKRLRGQMAGAYRQAGASSARPTWRRPTWPKRATRSSSSSSPGCRAPISGD